MEENKTIETITKSYEEKVVELEKQHQSDIETIKKQMEKEKEDALKEQQEKHQKELADFILGRKEIMELKKDEEKKNEQNEKSFFDKAVEKTKELVKKGV